MTAIAIEVVRELPDTLDDLFPAGSVLVRLTVAGAVGGAGKKYRFVFAPEGTGWKLVTIHPAAGGETPPLVQLAESSVFLDDVRKKAAPPAEGAK